MQQQDLSPSRNREEADRLHLGISLSKDPEIHVHIAIFCSSMFWADTISSPFSPYSITGNRFSSKLHFWRTTWHLNIKSLKLVKILNNKNNETHDFWTHNLIITGHSWHVTFKMLLLTGAHQSSRWPFLLTILALITRHNDAIRLQ